MEVMQTSLEGMISPAMLLLTTECFCYKQGPSEIRKSCFKRISEKLFMKKKYLSVVLFSQI